MASPVRLVATASRGTESICAGELRGLGLSGVRERVGAVEFSGSLIDGLRACLELRSAMRVLLPFGQVEAPGPEGLYDGLRTLPWHERLDLRRTFAIDVTGQSEGLTHTLFVAQKAKDAIVDALRDRWGARPDVSPKDPDVRIVLHLHKGKADVSFDVAGESLHRRGWRARPHPASLKETLAAAILLASGYTGEVPLVDPMCGAGTIAIEAALLAARRAPNATRRFGAERWPSFGDAERQALARLREEAQARERKDAPPIFASDRDEAAIESARENARRAKVRVELTVADARELSPLSPAGFLVTNPPYGVREGAAGGQKQLKTYFHALGDRYRALHGHTLAFLAGAPSFESAFGMRPVSKKKLWNGPLECELLVYEP
ncbi:MAG: THUMP domain-containing class I SAM-dependent RNA methyltransferase [Deltaproteobacteria bacterium]